MKTLFFIKLALIGFVAGAVGIVFKIMHWPYSGWIVLLSLVLIVTGMIVSLFKVIRHPAVKKFFNEE